MNESSVQKVMLSIEDSFNDLASVESILKLTYKACVDKEINANYYNLSKKEMKYLSEERNHYINMLNIAIDKVQFIMENNLKIEKELCNL